MTFKGVPEVSKELQSTGKVEYPCISIAIAPHFQAKDAFRELFHAPTKSSVKCAIKEDSKDEDRDKSMN